MIVRAALPNANLKHEFYTMITLTDTAQGTWKPHYFGPYVLGQGCLDITYFLTDHFTLKDKYDFHANSTLDFQFVAPDMSPPIGVGSCFQKHEIEAISGDAVVSNC